MGTHQGSTPGSSRPTLRAFDRSTGTGRALLTAAGVALAAPLGLALVGALVGAGAAEAHANLVSGSATCATDGTYKVTWTVANDFDSADTLSVIDATGSKPTFSPSTIPASTQAAKKIYNTATATQVLPGSTTSASITVAGSWADGVTRTATQTIAMSGKCVAPVIVTGGSTPTTAAPAPTSTGASCPSSGPLTDVSYLVDGVVQQSLVGTRMSQHVVARFTVAAGCAPQTLSLVTYHAPSSNYQPSEVADQVYADSATGTFGPGAHQLEITTPACNFQIDFVYGKPIEHLTADQYHNEGLWISGQNSGGTSCSDIPTTPPTTPATTPVTTPVTTPATTPVTTPVTTPPTTPPATSTSVLPTTVTTAPPTSTTPDCTASTTPGTGTGTTSTSPSCCTTTTSSGTGSCGTSTCTTGTGGTSSSTSSSGATCCTTGTSTSPATSTSAGTSSSTAVGGVSTSASTTGTHRCAPLVTDVLGETFTKDGPSVADTSAVLPFTGNNTILFVEIAGALLGVGLVLRALGGRRRARG